MKNKKGTNGSCSDVDLEDDCVDVLLHPLLSFFHGSLPRPHLDLRGVIRPAALALFLASHDLLTVGGWNSSLEILLPRKLKIKILCFRRE